MNLKSKSNNKKESSVTNENANENENVHALSAAFGSVRVGKAEEAVKHTAPTRVHALISKRRSARNSEIAWKGKQKPFTLGKSRYVYLKLETIPGMYASYKKTPLLKSRHKTAKLRALNKRRRRAILGRKNETRRPGRKTVK
jgi:hypothetical protein